MINYFNCKLSGCKIVYSGRAGGIFAAERYEKSG